MNGVCVCSQTFCPEPRRTNEFRVNETSFDMRSPINIRTLRDMARREEFASTEMLRRAYLYLARNEALSMKVSQVSSPLKSQQTTNGSTRLKPT
jgi:hypothetical protein